MDDVIALFRSEYFVTGIRLALLALALTWVVWAIVRNKWRILPVTGVVIAGLLVGTLAVVEGSLDAVIVPGLGVIFLALVIARVLNASPVVQALSSIPGALVLAIGTDVTELLWVRITMAVLIPVGGYLVSDFELRHDSLGLGVIFYTLATLGVFGAIPDTEWAVTLLIVSWVLVFVAWPKAIASLGSIGSYLAVAVLIWVSAHGGAARNASIVGAIACLGLLILEPIIIRINPSAMRVAKFVKRGWVGAIVAAIPQFLIVLVCSRIAARFTSELPALIIVGFVYGAVVVLGVFTGSQEHDTDGFTA